MILLLFLLVVLVSPVQAAPTADEEFVGPFSTWTNIKVAYGAVPADLDAVPPGSSDLRLLRLWITNVMTGLRVLETGPVPTAVHMVK